MWAEVSGWGTDDVRQVGGAHIIIKGCVQVLSH